MEFGYRFKKFRQDSKLTQCQVAKKIGIDQTNISNWENNKTRPEYEHLFALADVFDVSLDELLGRKDFY